MRSNKGAAGIDGVTLAMIETRQEEMLEMLTWSQLGIHRKPVGVLNVAGPRASKEVKVTLGGCGG